MCQFSARDGKATTWHQTMLGSYALRGASCVMTEVAAVLPEGRITPEDLGLWEDDQIAPLKQIMEFIKAHGQVPAIQIGHAGRKGGLVAPWLGRRVAAASENGFEHDIQGPSPFEWDETFAKPREMSLDDIENVKQAFADTAIRCEKAGAQVIDIHGAHGYLLHSFISPVSNLREDNYGGSFENRIRIVLEILRLLRERVPNMVIFYRISATDRMEPKGWTIEDTIKLAEIMHKENLIDLLDVSSAGNDPSQSIPKKLTQGYQYPFAAAVKQAVPGLHVSTVGLFTEAEKINEVLETEIPSAVMIGREFLRDPNFVLRCAYDLKTEVYWPKQLHRSGYNHSSDFVPKHQDRLEDEYTRPWLENSKA